MRLAIRVSFVAVGTVLLIGVDQSPDHASRTGDPAARAATVFGVQQPSDDQ